MNRFSTIQCVVLGCLRIIGLVFCLLAAFSARDLIHVAVYAADGGGWSYFLGGEGVAAVVSSSIWLTAAIGLCAFGPRLAAWLTPCPGARCLRCGHRLDAANNGVCPECGAS